MTFSLYGGRANWDQTGKTNTAGNTIWVEDSLPAGAITVAEGGDNWTWLGPSPNPYSGSAYHQSNLAAGTHHHWFTGATQTLQINSGDRLYAYVYLDPANSPSEVMLQWAAIGETGHPHRAYWGANHILVGADGTESRQYMGPLPPTGQWVRLEAPANLIGLEGKTVNGMAFTLYGGSASWDKAGKTKLLLNTGSTIHFDLDSGNPAPGFRLGFPVVQRYFFNPQAGKNAYLLIMPSGQAVELREVSQNVFESVDSSYLHLTYNPVDNSMNLRPPDGTQMRLEFKGGEYKPTQIKDRNGNYITINYGAGSGGAEISTIVDTLDRTITFNYDTFSHLNSITQSWGGQTHTWATFSYGTQVIQTNFPGLSLQGVANGSSVSVLTRVGLADGSIYKFEYNTYAQVKAIRKFAPEDADSTSFPEEYVERAYTTYNLPADSSAPQSDCPHFTMRTDWAIEHWAGGSWSATNTTYGPAIPNGTEGYVTSPDGTLERAFFATIGWQRGLTTQTETWSGGARKKWTTIQWTQDNTGVSYQLNPRVVETNVYDDAGNRSRSTISYTNFGLPIDVSQYDANGTTVLRRTHTDYNLNTVYTNRRIIGLPSQQFLYDGNNNLFSKVDYRYDLGGTYQEHQGPPVRHDTTNYGQLFVQGRGNLNSMRRWDVTDPNNGAKVSEYKTGYNTSGSVIFSRDPLNHQTSISYTDSFSDGVNHNTFAYPTKVTDPDNFFSTVKHNFDFGAVTHTEDPKGAVFTRTYDAIGRLEQVTNQVNMAYTRYEYTPDQQFVESYTTIKDLATEFYSATRFDGHGRVRAELADHPTSVGQYRAKINHYDEMGRMARPNNWAEIYADWQPAGDDAGGTGQTHQAYDWQGKPTVFTNQDGTTRVFEYGGCGCAGRNWVEAKEEVLAMPFTGELRRRKIRTTYDVTGRVSKVEQFHISVFVPENTVYRTTTYTYNARNQATSIKVYAGESASDGACPSGTCQETTLEYDGHGRLSARHKPIDEQNTNSLYEYYGNDRLKKVTDPRGVAINYTYYGRPLLKDISYGGAAEVSTNSPVHFEYDGGGNRTLMSDAFGEARYFYYNNTSRIQYETRQFNDINVTSRIDYQYNISGQLRNISINATGVSLSYNYNRAGQMIGVTGSGYSGVSTFLTQATYRASGAVKTLAYGNGRVMNYGYNSRLQVSHMDMPGVISSDYTYNGDGRLKEISSVPPSSGATQISLDRRYNYDEMGRFSGLARAPFLGLASEGYRIEHIYNAFDNMETQAHKFGLLVNDTISAYNTTWLNNRNQDPKIGQSGYDRAGNLKRYDNRIYTNNSVGKPVSLSDLNLSYAYDGDSLRVKEVRTSPPQQGIPPNLLNYTTYFVRSTVLGGTVVMELDGSGQRKWDYIYGVSGELLAEHNPTGQEMPGHKFGPRDIPDQPQMEHVPYIPPQPNKVLWYHLDPHNAMVWTTRTDGNLIKQNVENLYTTYETQEKDLAGNILDYARISYYFAFNQSAQILSELSFVSPYLGNAANVGAGCNIDGVQAPCNTALSLVNSNAAKAVQVSDLFLNLPPYLNPFGSDVIIVPYLDGEIEYEKMDPETGDLIGYGYLPTFRTEIRALSMPQNLQVNATRSGLNTGPSADLDLLKFIACLDIFYGVKPYSSDVESMVGLDMGYAGFLGYSWRGQFGKSGTINVDFDFTKNSTQLGKMYRQGNPSFRGRQSGLHDPQNPHMAYIASDVIKGVQNGTYKMQGFDGVLIHELGNALGALKYMGSAEAMIPKHWKNQRMAVGSKDPDSGAAFETCVFGGIVGLKSGRIGGYREAP